MWMVKLRDECLKKLHVNLKFGGNFILRQFIQGRTFSRFIYANILKSPKDTKNASFFKKLMISQKSSFKLFFSTKHMLGKFKIVDYVQKKSGVIFLKPKLLARKHGEYLVSEI